MKKLFLLFAASVVAMSFVRGQQLPDPHFEDWSDEYNGDKQPKYWHGSNVTQVGFKFTFMYQKEGRTGYCAYVANKEVGALGITEVGPGYFSMGNAWQSLDGIKVNSATAGTDGGFKFAYRPDTVSVWIKRTGNNTDKEDFHVLYYAWSGTSKGNKYKAKDGSCSSTSHDNEESDIRIALDKNECGTAQKANQIAEGWLRARAKYDQWTQVKIPIYYMNDDTPQMCNLLFSAGNYPNYRANSGLYEGNALYVDDVELIYSSLIQTLYVGNKEWKGFDPYSSEEQTYSLGESATTLPAIEAWRGKGQLSNAKNETAIFNGRKLSGDEIKITNGVIDGAPTTITVKSGDGKSTHTYKIKFVRAASSNANLAGIKVNGIDIADFRPTNTNYSVALPFGTTDIPVVSAIGQEDAQTITITQPTSLTGTATIKVTAANKVATKEYKLTFSIAQLSDNTLQGITVNGSMVPGFSPSLTMYKVSLPLGTTKMPDVKAISAYPNGAQTIQYKAPSQIDGGTYEISVTSPGNPTPKVYKLAFKLEASSYSYLQSLSVGDYLTGFEPTQFIYYINLPLGTTQLPKIEYELGDPYQTVDVADGGLNGTTRITVTAGNKTDVSVYKLVVTTAKSDFSFLKMIYLDEQPLIDFAPNTTDYSFVLPIGTTKLPTITVDKGDEWEQVSILPGGLNGITRLSVVAQDGTTTIYQIKFSVETSSDATLRMIYIDGLPLEGFDAEVTDYVVNLPKGTTQTPAVTYDEGEHQTITVRDGGVNGEYKITVRPQTGASMTYRILFVVESSSNTALQSILIDGKALEEFNPETLDYTVTLPAGVSTIPTVTFTKAEDSQRVLSVLDNTTMMLTVTAESGAKRVYTITFVIQKSENAFLDMIYLDGKELMGFESQTLEYHYTLLSERCPTITVDAASGQQIVIGQPFAAGDARILVTPESGSANQYVIHFYAKEQEHLTLNNIYADAVPLEGFDPTKREYTLVYADSFPTITWNAPEEYRVTALRSGEVVTIYVQFGDIIDTYRITCTQHFNDDTTLQNILLDGIAVSNYQPNKTDYTISLPAGSEIPVVSYVTNHPSQSVTFGQSTPNTMEIHVKAQNGSTATYKVTFDVALYSDATLENLALSNGELIYNPEKTEYSLELDNGETLPDVLVTSKPGQTTLLNQVNANKQEVIVVAQDGTTKTYSISYSRKISSNCLLQTILLDGEPLEGFDPAIYAYIDTLEWRTRVIPNIQAVGQLPNQTITTYFCAVNGTARIHVVADNGVFSDYQIEFPVRKSGNTALEDLYLGTDIAEITFNPNTTDYEIALPYQTEAVPEIIYEAAEPEQTISFISRPLGDTTQVIVTAENGDQRVYNLYFYAEDAAEENRLQTLYIKELDQNLSLKDKTQRNFEVTLPYGTRSLTVEYEKMFPEQTVFVQPGGVNAPTILTVKGNRKGDEDQVYTITPIVPTNDPAVLTDILVNGTSIPGFSSEQFSYIVNVTTKPTLKYVLNKGAEINILNQTSKHWQAEVSYNGRTNVYDVWYYYVNETIPNGGFTEWTNCAAFTSAKKPTGWNTVADALGKHSGFGTFSPDELVTKSGADAVHLKTQYSAPGGGEIPGFITLGKVSGKWGVAGSTNISISGGISFHNSPDQMLLNYYSKSVQDNNLIQYTLNGSDGEAVIEWKEGTSSSYSTHTYDLTAANNQAGDPTLLNITLCSYYTTSGTIASSSPEMYVDWVRFAYNHTLKGLKVNGVDAAMSDTKFEVTLTDPELIERPILEFTGEVADQVAQVTWQTETTSGAFGIRKASIRNYAENGTDYTDYTLTVKRPLCTKNTLDSVYVGGKLATLHAGQKDTIHLKSSVHNLPDVVPFPASSRQKVTTNYVDSTYTITVTPEYGEAKVYTIRFVTDLSDDTTLSNIVGVSGFAPNTRDYTVTAETMPKLTFVKKMDGQTVTLHNGVLTVVAENGAVGTYTIDWQRPSVTTSAQIKSFEFEGNPVSGFGGTNYEIESSRPTLTAFVRQDEKDSVIYTQYLDKMTWQVIGSEEHTYTLTYPSFISNNALLADIRVNGQTIDNFNPQIKDYTIYSDTAISMCIIGEHINQIISTTTSHDNGISYTIEVTAEDNITKSTYKLSILPMPADIATLDAIWIDGELIPDFRPDSFSYTKVYSTPTIKVREPAIPSISYAVTQAQENVEIEMGEMNGQTLLTVRSGDGMVENIYSIDFQSEPSHNTDLTGIIVNGLPMERFESGRHYYSTSVEAEHVEITWTADDQFQSVELIPSNGIENIIRVTAQDGVTVADYVVDVYVVSQSNNATLANIQLNGLDLDDFESSLNDKLSFSPMKNQYTINLPSGTLLLPQVSATTPVIGQTITLRHEELNVYVDVTAPDGVAKNTYTLNFAVPLSNNANLSMIYCDGDSLEGFTPDYYYYLVTLPVGVHTLPEIVAQKGQNNQVVTEPVIEADKNRATIRVTAEDCRSTSTYVVVFEFERSTADTLVAIYEDGSLLPNFNPHIFNYKDTLAPGTTAFPDLSWDVVDDWQKVDSATILRNATQLIRQINVTAEAGNTKAYTISYVIMPSDVDTLQMLYVDNKPLANFDSHKMDYYYTLDATATSLPEVFYAQGDEFQTITIAQVEEQSSIELPDSVKVVNQKIILQVQAQSGRTRIYTIHFSMIKSSDATLGMIMLKGNNLSGFISEQFTYRGEPLRCNESVPVVTVVKKHDAQQVDIQIVTSPEKADTVKINVVAEDGKTNEEYRVIFEDNVSENFFLSNIVFSDGYYIPFDSLRQEYTLNIPYGIDTIPDVMPIVSDECQTIEISTAERISANQMKQTISVFPYNNTMSYTYTITYMFLRPSNADIEMVYLDNVPLQGFRPNEYDYYVEFEEGTSVQQMYQLDQVKVILNDTNATYTLQQDSLMSIYIHVLAQDSTTQNIYTIHQIIGLSHDNYLKDILLDSVSIRDFSPEITFYTYYVPEGGIPPSVTAVARHPKAEVNVKMAQLGDTTIIYCIAENGETRRYDVLFARSTIVESQAAVGEDVLLKHLSGNQILVATIRTGVAFALFDQQGGMLEFIQQIPLCDQNNAVLATYADDKTMMMDVLDISKGVVIDVIPNKIYLYAFYENGKNRIAFGKFMTLGN